MDKRTDAIELREPSRDGIHDGRLQAKVYPGRKAIVIRDLHLHKDFVYTFDPQSNGFDVNSYAY